MKWRQYLTPKHKYPPTKPDRVKTRSIAVWYLGYHTLWHSLIAEIVCASLHLYPST